MSLRVVTPATGLIMSLDDAKAHLRVTWNDEDDLIQSLIKTAQSVVENWTQRRYMAQTLEWVTDAWSDPMVLPVAPGAGSTAASIVSVTYATSDGSSQILSPTLYWDRPAGETRALVRRWFQMYPWLGDAAERVVIRFSITGDATTVPPGAIHAMKLLISHFRENREAVVGVDNRDSSTPLPLGVEMLLMPERWS